MVGPAENTAHAQPFSFFRISEGIPLRFTMKLVVLYHEREYMNEKAPPKRGSPTATNDGQNFIFLAMAAGTPFLFTMKAVILNAA